MPWKSILCLIKHHAIRMYGGIEVQLLTFLTSALNVGESSASWPSHFKSWERPPVPTEWEVGWAKRKYPCLCRKSNPGRPAPSLVTILTELSRQYRKGDIQRRRRRRRRRRRGGCDCIMRIISSLKLLQTFDDLTWFLGTTRTETYEGVSKSFQTGCLERELQMVQLSATRCSCIAILWVSLVSFAAITLCVGSQRVFIVVSVYFVMTQSGNFWIHPRIRNRHDSISFSRCLLPGWKKCAQHFGG
jgi:hypothetical protein